MLRPIAKHGEPERIHEEALFMVRHQDCGTATKGSNYTVKLPKIIPRLDYGMCRLFLVSSDLSGKTSSVLPYSNGGATHIDLSTMTTHSFDNLC